MHNKTETARVKTGILFSGGKDSCLALGYAMKYTDVVCLINILSENPESYMFHTPNAQYAKTQAEAIGLPIIIRKTPGIEEEELEDLEQAIRTAVEQYHIEGIVTGAIDSAYQSSRIQRICDKLGILCFNPLWKKDQIELLEEIIHDKFDVIIIGTFGEGVNTMLARKIDEEFLEKALELKKNHINPAGEGGEMESFVLDGPFFKKKINIVSTEIIEDKEGALILSIEDISLEKKEHKETHKISLPIQSSNLENNVVIINLNTHPLHDYEFIKPIADIVKNVGKTSRIIHYTEANIEMLKHADRIILAGTSLKNMEYVNYADKLAFLKELNTPILGICAGMQLISLIYGASLEYGQEIGLRDGEFYKFLGLIGTNTIYTLHNNIVVSNESFLKEFDVLGHTTIGGEEVVQAIKHKHKPIYATLFHPEARNKDVIETFLY
jgi:ABC transporter with metal-binding/Fe-S-binding domain ATP-binding protein